MKQFFKNLFDDSNSINEKSVVGFAAFVIMVIFAVADGKDLVINEFIFNSFMWLVLGSFGIGSVDKWINKKGE